MKQSGGSIWIYSEPEQGTTFKIYLPQIPGTAEQQENPSINQRPVDGNETILIVEDDDSLRKMSVNILKKYGYFVVEAPNGMVALEIATAEEKLEIDLLVTDVTMPKMGGMELSNTLQKEYPAMKVLFISGYTDNAITHHGVLDEGVSLLQKPFSPWSLVERVRKMLDKE